MTQTNPEQWAVELAQKLGFGRIGADTAAEIIQAAFAEREARNHTAATPVAWMPIESAPKGVPTKDVGCRGESEWFLGKPSGKYPQSAPFVAICRRAWPQDDSWKDAGDTHYRPDYFSEWCPIETSHPPATDVAEQDDTALLERLADEACKRLGIDPNEIVDPVGPVRKKDDIIYAMYAFARYKFWDTEPNDVAALVKAATRLFEISGWSKHDTEICHDLRQALAPFTKGQNDDA